MYSMLSGSYVDFVTFAYLHAMYVCFLYEFLDTYLKFVLIVNLYVPVHILGVGYVYVKRG